VVIGLMQVTDELNLTVGVQCGIGDDLLKQLDRKSVV
jgi:hypothetical protein